MFFAKHLAPAKVSAFIFPFIKKFAEDKSWRIRYLLAEKIMDLTQAIGVDNSKEILVPHYIQFLSDSESEVRTAALS